MRAPSAPRVIATHAALLLLTVATMLPLLWVIRMALSPSQGFSIGLSLTDFTLDNFRSVLATTTSTGEALFARQLFNSLVVSAATAALGVVLACTAGYALSRWSFPGREQLMGSFLVMQMFPAVVMSVPLYMLLDALHLLDSLAGLVLVYATTSVPFATWNLKGYFDTIPRELEEAATMDGASRWTTFTRVILPLARPAIAVTALFAFMTAWNEFILAATLMGDERAYTLPVVLNGYVGEFGAEWGKFAAGSIIVSVPVVALFFVLQKQLVEGLTAGGVKG
ncbi:MAG: sugar ABC transporter permease [Deltaproteobacteria bacterium]|nr:sugar ABC transporter permease [Deltaproteobacteria bacterium]MBM4391113.1 sugar ABC transporter permease [Deltaproteobacteria bacterium]